MDERLAADLLDFVRRNFVGEGRAAPPSLDTPLLSEQLLDSMGVALLATFIEERCDVPFDGSELRVGRLESVREIAELIARRRA
jgi:acyl carrier protein